MEFKERGSIYLQIAEYVCDQVLMGKWPAGTKLPSIREMSVTMQVTTITVQRAYDFLLQTEIITNKRGIGFFTTDEAEAKIYAHRRTDFLKHDVPAFLKNMLLLKVPVEEILRQYEALGGPAIKQKR